MSYSGPHFPRIQTEYGEIRGISPYSVRMQENADQNNSKCGHFLRSDLTSNESVLGRFYMVNHIESTPKNQTTELTLEKYPLEYNKLREYFIYFLIIST